MRHGALVAQAQFVIKADDDTYFHMDRLQEALRPLPSSHLYLGRMACHAKPHRDPNSAWFVPQAEYAEQNYPPFAHGPGYVVSRDISAALAQLEQNGELRFFKLEDVAMALWLDQLKKRHRMRIRMVQDERFAIHECTEQSVSAHNQSPQQQRCIWRKHLARTKKPSAFLRMVYAGATQTFGRCCSANEA